jgi:oligopeptide transport system ATP-binding protein
VPRLGRARSVALNAIPGNVPNPRALPPGCAFHPRCGFFAPGRCDRALPAIEHPEPGRSVRCVRWREIEVPAKAAAG